MRTNELVEEEVDEAVQPRATIDSAKIIESIKSNRAEIRTVTPALLEACGLLLTISLGAIYFILTDNKDLSIYLPEFVRYILFAIPIALSIAILLGILSIYLRKGPSAVDDETIIMSTLSANYRLELCLFFWSNVFLGCAIFAIIISLLVFAYECNNGNTAHEVAKGTLAQNIFLVIPNHNTSADIINITALAHNITSSYQ